MKGLFNPLKKCQARIGSFQWEEVRRPWRQRGLLAKFNPWWGPALSFGYSWAVSGRPSSSIRSSLGASYYSLGSSGNSTHTQSFLTSDLLWVESNHVSSLAFGLTAVGSHTYKGAGVESEFDPTFGPKIAVEIRGSMGVSLGAYMSWMTFKDENGNEFDGDQIGLYLMRLY